MSSDPSAEIGPKRRPVISAALALAFISFYVLPLLIFVLSKQPIPFPMIMAAGDALIVFATMPVVDRLTRRHTRGSLRVAIGGAVGVTMGGLSGMLLWQWLQDPTILAALIERNHPAVLPKKAFVYFCLSAAMSLFAIGTWSLSFVLPAAWEEQRVRALEVANLRLEATELRTSAELTRLRAQIEPHFLLNTLNLIAGLVDVDAERARHTIVCLGDVFRDALVAEGELHSLADEVAWLRRYCEILELRHGHALRVSWEIDPSAEDALIPRLLLQPLVENAVAHGALRRRGGGRVDVRIERQSPHVIACVIADDGPGITGSLRTGAIGVENVRRRLALSSPSSRLVLESGERGTRAVVTLSSHAKPAPRSEVLT